MRTKAFLILLVVVFCYSRAVADPSVIMDYKQFPQVDIPSILLFNKDKAEYAKVIESIIDVWENLTEELRKSAKTSSL
jgi:hypothetical protein